MKNLQARFTLLCLLVAPLSTALGQTGSNERRGPASGLAAGLSLRVGPNAQLVKAPGRQTAPPTGWTRLRFITGPDYTAQLLFGPLAPLVDVDATSTGSDIIPAPGSNGVPNLVSAGRWLGIVASVKNDAVGMPNSLIELARQGGRSSGADLFAHYYQESSGIDPELAGGTFVAQTREALGFGTANQEDVDALDFGLGVRSFGGLPAGADPLFIEHNSFYFSVTPQSATLLNAATASQFALDEFQNLVPAHAADIYLLEWVTDKWVGPLRYRDWGILGLQAGDDIDAIAVDPNGGTTIFSTQVVAQRSQLLIHESIFGSQPLMSEQQGTGTLSLVTEKFGGVDDTTDIDAVCILDPIEFTYSAYFGTPTGWLSASGLSSPMGLSVTRTGMTGLDSDVFAGSGSGADTLHVQLSGRRGAANATTMVTFFMSKNYDPLSGWGAASWKPLADPMWRQDDGTEKTITLDFQAVVPDAPTNTKIAIVALVLDKKKKVVGGSWISELMLP